MCCTVAVASGSSTASGATSTATAPSCTACEARGKSSLVSSPERTGTLSRIAVAKPISRTVTRWKPLCTPRTW